jgi:hypothetical protein
VVNRLEQAITLLAGLTDHVGQWGPHAVEEQWGDARAILDVDSQVRRHWIGRSKGFSKSRDCAGMSIAWLLTQAPPGASGYVAASDSDQASLVRQSCEAFVASTPALVNHLRIDRGRVVARSGAELVILAADSAGSHGLRPHWLVVDELANFPDVERHRSFFDSLWAGLAKIPGSRGIVITTAGSPSHFSRKIYETARDDPSWRLSDLSGPAPWIPAEEVEAERRRLSPSLFQRWWENEWTAAEDSVADPDDIAFACRLEGPLAPVEGRKYICSLDLGVKRDRSVAVVAHADRTGDTTQVIVDQLKVWKPRRGHQVELESVRLWLVEFCRLYHAPLHYDPSQAFHMTEQLRAAGIKCTEFLFTSSSVGQLAGSLVQGLRSRTLSLPDDADLKQELLSVRLRESSPGVLRIDTRSGGFDDMVVAVGMAAHLLFHDVPKRRPRMYRLALNESESEGDKPARTGGARMTGPTVAERAADRAARRAAATGSDGYPADRDPMIVQPDRRRWP